VIESLLGTDVLKGSKTGSAANYDDEALAARTLATFHLFPIVENPQETLLIVRDVCGRVSLIGHFLIPPVKKRGGLSIESFVWH
jgi:hypothetical protein